MFLGPAVSRVHCARAGVMEGRAGTLQQSIVHGGGAGSHRPMGGGAPDRANHSLYLYALDRKSRPLLKQRTENELAHVPHTNISQHLHPRVPSQHPSRAPDPYMLCKAQPTLRCHSRARCSTNAAPTQAQSEGSSSATTARTGRPWLVW